MNQLVLKELGKKIENSLDSKIIESRMIENQNDQLLVAIESSFGENYGYSASELEDEWGATLFFDKSSDLFSIDFNLNGSGADVASHLFDDEEEANEVAANEERLNQFLADNTKGDLGISITWKLSPDDLFNDYPTTKLLSEKVSEIYDSNELTNLDELYEIDELKEKVMEEMMETYDEPKNLSKGVCESLVEKIVRNRSRYIDEVIIVKEPDFDEIANDMLSSINLEGSASGYVGSEMMYKTILIMLLQYNAKPSDFKIELNDLTDLIEEAKMDI